MDMTESIAPKSDQMNAEDLLAGPRTFTIMEVRNGSSADQPVSVYVAEHPQPFKPSKTVRRLMVVAWGPESSAYVGKRMTLYRDPAVRFGGEDVGGIRVSHMSGIREPVQVKLATTRGRRAPFVVQPLPDEPSPSPTALDGLVAAFDAARVPAGERRQYCRDVVRRPIASASDLTPAEVRKVIDSLGPAPAAASTPPAEPAAVEPERVSAEPSDDEWAAMQRDSGRS